MDDGRTFRRSIVVGAAALVALVAAAAFAPGAGAGGDVSGRARARAGGVEQLASQPGATLFGDTIAELDVPLARTSLETFGGTSALASVAYPGDLVGNVDALCAIGGSECPAYPFIVRAAFPPTEKITPEQKSTVADAGPVRAGTMEARARDGSAVARAAGAEAAVGEGEEAPVRASALEAEAAVSSIGGTITARSVSSGRGISIAGGVVWIARYSSVAQASSDGTTRKGSGHTEAFGVTVAGIPVTLDEDGAHVAAGAGTGPVSDNEVGRALGEAGIDVRLVEGAGGPDANSVRGALGEAGGIVVTITGPQGVTQRIAIGRASASVDVLSLPTPTVSLGGGTVVSGGAFAAPAAPPAALYSALPPPAVAPAAPVAPAVQAVAAPVPDRRGLGLAVPLGILVAVILTGIWLTYARWQLLDWLPRAGTGEGS